MVNVRKSISRRLTQLKKTRHWLAKETDMRPATVYGYLKGDADVVTEKAERMLTVLGLEIRPKE